jgi:hypothetical protein
MKELAAACKKEGIHFAFITTIMTWHQSLLHSPREWEKDRPEQEPDF